MFSNGLEVKVVKSVHVNPSCRSILLIIVKLPGAFKSVNYCYLFIYPLILCHLHIFVFIFVPLLFPRRFDLITIFLLLFMFHSLAVYT